VRFAGYVAVFDRPDRGGDVIRKGAFLASLKRAGEVPLLWQHKTGAVVGRIEHLSEDSRGLRVIASLADARAVKLLGNGIVVGLSFG
jgi:HK97 family phage prohead protease